MKAKYRVSHKTWEFSDEFDIVQAYAVKTETNKM